MSGRVVLEAERISKRFRVFPSLKFLGVAHVLRERSLRSSLEFQGFREIQAVKNVTLQVREGDVYGFLGPNGAGKTTSIRVMLGLIGPTGGHARVFGYDIRRDFKLAIREVGAFVEGPAFYPYMSGRKNLRIFGRISGGVSESRIGEALELVGMARRGDHKVKGYSQGMRQRLGIALALLHRPRLLVLDEPTNGLDPQGMREVRNLIRRIRDEERTTIFLSSHLLGEMEQLCDRIGIVSRGELVREGSMEDLLGSSADIVSIKTEKRYQDQVMKLLAEKHGAAPELVRQGVIEFEKGGIGQAALNAELVGEGFAVSEIVTRRKTLEEYFVELTGDSKDVH